MIMKKQWREAYQLARIIHRAKPSEEDALASLDGLYWRAWLIVRFGRNRLDPITCSPEQNRITRNIVQEVLDELDGEQP